MKLYKNIILMIFISMLASCTPLLQSFRDEKTDFTNYKRIAVTSFVSNSDYLTGQILSDFVSAEFLKKSYKIIERNQIKTLINEKILNTSGLTEGQKKELKMSGIDAIVTGSLQFKSELVPQVDKEIKENLFNKNSIITVKMIDSQTGEVLWLASGIHSERNNNNADIINFMESFLKDLQKQIPEIETKKLFWIF